MSMNPPGKSENGSRSGAPSWFAPIQLLDVEIEGSPAAIPVAADAQGDPYTRAIALVRLNGRPIGTVAFDIPEQGLDGQTLQELIRERLPSDPDLDRAAEIDAERNAFLARAPFASVVIATRNRPDNLARCLESLSRLLYPEFEVIVVDNAPSDDATERFFAAHCADRPNVRYVREDRPGLASAHNCGLRKLSARSRYVAFTDDDVVVDRYWLCELIRGFEATANVGCVTGLIYPAELETWPQLLIEEFGGFNKGFRRQVYDLRRHRPIDRLFPFTPGRFGSGANMAFRAEVLTKIGGFDHAIGTGTPALGGDDLAAFFRVITAGYALVYEPAAIVRHTHYRDYTTLQRQIYGYGVGLTAFLTKSLLDQPNLVFDLAGKAPRGLWYALSPGSGKNAKKGPDYPVDLTQLERKGMVDGPIAYLRSRVAARRYDQQAPAVDDAATVAAEAMGMEQQSLSRKMPNAPNLASLKGEHGYAESGDEHWPPRSSWLDRVPRFSPIRRPGPIILMYHQVAVLEMDPWSLAVSPRHFAEQLEVLAQRREVVSLRRLTDEIDAPRLDSRHVAITFDDGYADNLTNAKPILEQFGFPATVFVVGDAVGLQRELWWDELDRVFLGQHSLPDHLEIRCNGRTHSWDLGDRGKSDLLKKWRGSARDRVRLFLWRRLRALPAPERWRVIDELQAWAGQVPEVRPERRVMTADEVVRLGANGLIEIGAHTASHPRLAALPPNAQLEDIVRGKMRLEEIIGGPITSFSYPFGGQLDVSSITVKAVRKAGFERACTTRKGTVQPHLDPFRLPRIYVADWSAADFERQLAPWL